MTTQTTLFRSEAMTFIQIYIPFESARTTVAQLGEAGLVEFVDLNPQTNAFQRAFVGEIRRLDEMDRKLRYFKKQLHAGAVPAVPLSECGFHLQIRSAQDMSELENSINACEARLIELMFSYEQLQRKHMEVIELRHVLIETNPFFLKPPTHEISEDAPLLNQGDLESQFEMRPTGLNFVAGVIPRKRMAAFERILWRSLRGNLVLNFSEIADPIVDPVTDTPLTKNAFIIFAFGVHMIEKIRKISESLGATLYPVSEHADLRSQTKSHAELKIQDLNEALFNTSVAIHSELLHIGQTISVWTNVVRKEKAIYHTLNLFNHDANRRCLLAEGWCAANDIGHVQDALFTSGEYEISLSPILNRMTTRRKPPTYHRTNKFTEGFQAIVDSYGVSNYGEVNPGLFTIISFPFLFAVMFGDLGHAIIMTSAALYMVLNERALGKIKSEEFAMFYGGRYIILLMGLFSIFTGLIYNDIFSRSMTLFESGWVWPELHEAKAVVSATQVGIYPFGIDSAWHGADNALIFTNSFKMKMSVIFGVIQMSFGVVLTTFNYRHFNEHYSIYLEFIPQILFMLCIFGYLSFTIIYKWAVDWATRSNPPPSLLNMLIDMFLSPGTVLKENILFPGQAGLQLFLLLVALAAVPVMLFGKPMYLRHLHQQREAEGYSSLPTHNQGESHEMSHEEEFDFSELMIHQAIHTIEYCLNCISNTASYLRLWALSLAHAQLSTVLWDMVLVPALNVTGLLRPLALVVGGATWLILTVVILILMEGLSAFLHALRLHWVEFNGKFYGGTGQKFVPFHFETIVNESEI